MTAVDARQTLSALKARVEARLGDLAPEGGAPLAAAIRHALASPGKRLRPLLLLVTALELGQSVDAALDAACAVEMVHAASLVFDDLPCMDDAAERRGLPSTHALFGEDVAVLAGVALLNQAYGLLARTELVAPAERLLMIEALSGAVGLEGLVAGQAIDLREPVRDLATLRAAHQRKTAALFMAAVGLGSVLGRASVTEHLALEQFAAELGLAYQALDDVLDAADASADLERCTLVSLLGREGAAREAELRLAASRQALAGGGPRLQSLSAYVDVLLGGRFRPAEAAV